MAIQEGDCHGSSNQLIGNLMISRCLPWILLFAAAFSGGCFSGKFAEAVKWPAGRNPNLALLGAWKGTWRTNLGDVGHIRAVLSDDNVPLLNLLEGHARAPFDYTVYLELSRPFYYEVTMIRLHQSGPGNPPVTLWGRLSVDDDPGIVSLPYNVKGTAYARHLTLTSDNSCSGPPALLVRLTRVETLSTHR
jgi:hypothetical protein